MPFCPICKSEYNFGEQKCINCNCELAQEIPQKVHGNNSNDAEVFLCSANDGIELAMIEGRLRTAQIPYYLKNKETGSYMKVLMGFSVFGVDIYVTSNVLSKAKDILQIEDAYNDKEAIADEPSHEFVEQMPEEENEEFLDETRQNSTRFGIMVFLSIIFSPVLLVFLIIWLLWLGLKNIIKYFKS